MKSFENFKIKIQQQIDNDLIYVLLFYVRNNLLIFLLIFTNHNLLKIFIKALFLLSHKIYFLMSISVSCEVSFLMFILLLDKMT